MTNIKVVSFLFRVINNPDNKLNHIEPLYKMIEQAFCNKYINEDLFLYLLRELKMVKEKLETYE